ncbi:hypothetical protein [Bradyrhizobium valentinum]|nr:hypothetical protein [Bradyrhizobium valentinum]
MKILSFYDRAGAADQPRGDRWRDGEFREHHPPITPKVTNLG